MDEAELQKLRESSGLSLDACGQFFIHGEPVEHARSQLVLTQGMHRAPDGRWATRIGREWAYVDVADTAYFVRRIEPLEDPAFTGKLHAWLTRGDEVNVDADSLRLCASDATAINADALYLQLPDGELARLSRPAHLSLTDWLGDENGAYFLELGGRRYSIGLHSNH